MRAVSTRCLRLDARDSARAAVASPGTPECLVRAKAPSTSTAASSHRARYPPAVLALVFVLELLRVAPLGSLAVFPEALPDFVSASWFPGSDPDLAVVLDHRERASVAAFVAAFVPVRRSFQRTRDMLKPPA